MSKNITKEYFRLSEVYERYHNVSINFISDLLRKNLIAIFDSPGINIRELSVEKFVVSNTKDVSFENLKILRLHSTIFTSIYKIENLPNLEFIDIDLNSLRSLKSVSDVSSPKATISITGIQLITFCDVV